MVDCADNGECCRWTIAAKARTDQLGRPGRAIDDTEVFFGSRRLSLDIRVHRSTRIGLLSMDDTDISGKAWSGYGKRVGAGFYILRPLCAWTIYGESLSYLQWFGIALLTAGIVCVSANGLG